MSIDNKTQVSIESELSVSDLDSNHKNCSYCNQPFIEELWCKKCDPYKIIEGWTSENSNVDKFIKDTMYSRKYGTWLEWVPFDRFTNIEQIGEGRFSIIYSATWVDGKANYIYEYGNLKKSDSKPIKVALKRLIGSHEISIEYLNELKIHWNVYLEENFSLRFYGMTKDPITKEFIMIIELASEGSLRSIYLNEFNDILWDDKIRILGHLILSLNNLHKLGYFHKNLHGGNILVCYNYDRCYNTCISDFGLTGPANKQKSDDKIYGVLPYIAPEVLNGNPYTSSSDIYSFGIIMAELSSRKPPFYDRKYDLNLAIDICNGLRPEFGEGTPEFYKKLAYECMNSNPKQRPKADELNKLLIFWYHSINDEMFGYKGKEVKTIFKEANKEFGYKGKKGKAIYKETDEEILNVLISYRNYPNDSQMFSSSNLLPKSINSFYITSYSEENNNEDISNKHGNCSYCNKLTEELWCNECDPHYLIDGWISGISDIDKFIKDTIYNARKYNYSSLEWIPFDKFTNIKQIDENKLVKMYSATWIDGKSEYKRLTDGGWKKLKSKPIEIILKSLNVSQNISSKCLYKLKFYWNLCKKDITFKFYGITKNPKTEEIMMVTELINAKSLRNILTNDFKNILWKNKLRLLLNLALILKHLHELKYFFKDLHNGNILQNDNYSYLELFELAIKQKSDDKICGIMPYISPEVLLNGKSYTLASDIYSFGIIMTELSSGKPPFYDKVHNSSLATDICNGLRPEFGKGTPDIYKRLAYKCTNANLNERPTADELYQTLNFWDDILNDKVLGYIGKEIKAMFDDADKEIPNISTSYENNSDPKYVCQVFTFSNLPIPANSSNTILYLKETNNKESNQADNKICSYCNKPFIEKLWCKKCDPYCIIEGWTSENLNIDKFIKDSIYDARLNLKFLEWVSFDRFTNIKQIGNGGFAKVYSATWIDGKSEYGKLNDGSWKKLKSKPIEVALKKLNGSQNISIEYLNELKIYWNICLNHKTYLAFYGITKDPDTKEFIMIMDFANKGSLKSIFSHDFKNILWKDKINWLSHLAIDLENMHELGYLHKDLHSGNILLHKDNSSYISDFGLSRPANEQKLNNNKIYGVLPYIAPEVLNKEPYTSSSDIYSFGVIMAEISSGNPPFYDKKHNSSLALAICNGLRPEFGKGTPEIYKTLAYRCMDANPKRRPKAYELRKMLLYWYDSISDFDFSGKEIKTIFEKADKEISNISTLYKIDPDAIYTSRAFTFSNLPKPINSSIITSYIQGDEEVYCHDSQLVGLDVRRFW
ncbi:hypothetical protein RclHR1_02970011 [Rhizophagus clarus]|uniref:Kinase-like domain-containing protein n=1 Tax=Rhizophagus clarus TaxID=94130 RepID=A0A2Z6RYZ7_9GLOM|nr:hypothetical protein RclHR1_02970011 [Rhizophagus clarus]GES72869.1 kinase-like domain-containing protein [Rhizophagus clarus]